MKILPQPCACAVALVALLAPQAVQATMVMIPADDSGFLNAAGRGSKNDGVLLGAPPATFNYSTGSIAEVPPLSGTDVPRRNFFSFDLSGIASGTITSAALVLFVPIDGFSSPDASETYEITGIMATTPAEQSSAAAELTLVYDITDSAELAAAIALHDKIGDIVGLGAATFEETDEGSDVPVPLSAAGVSYLNTFAGGEVVLGGEITTLDLTDGIDEVVFGFSAPFYSGVVSPDPVIPVVTPTPFLLLDVIPEPSSAALVLVSSMLLWRRRR